MDLMEILINKLSKASKEFGIFMKYHFDIIRKQSLTPKVNLKGESLFPITTKIQKKSLSLLEKVNYYKEDLVALELDSNFAKDYELMEQLLDTLDAYIGELEKCYT